MKQENWKDKKKQLIQKPEQHQRLSLMQLTCTLYVVSVKDTGILCQAMLSWGFCVSALRFKSHSAHFSVTQ